MVMCMRLLVTVTYITTIHHDHFHGNVNYCDLFPHYAYYMYIKDMDFTCVMFKR